MEIDVPNVGAAGAGDISRGLIGEAGVRDEAELGDSALGRSRCRDSDVSHLRRTFFADGKATSLASRCLASGLAVVVVARVGNVPLLLWAGSKRAFFLAQFWAKYRTWFRILTEAGDIITDRQPSVRLSTVYPSEYLLTAGGSSISGHTVEWLLATISDKVRLRFCIYRCMCCALLLHALN